MPTKNAILHRSEAAVGAFGFWTLKTADGIDAVLAPGYFDGCAMLPFDRIEVTADCLCNPVHARLVVSRIEGHAVTVDLLDLRRTEGEPPAGAPFRVAA